MALVILDHTEVKPLIKIKKKNKKLLRPMVSGVSPLPDIDSVNYFSLFAFNPVTP